MSPVCRYPKRYMVSPCGRSADFYDDDKMPAGWSDCTGMSDTEVRQLMVRRMMDNRRMK